jgi:hypothetical protein
MKRIICHWTAGSHKANDTDLEHYHFVFEGNGTVKQGRYPISANAAPIRGKYAAHTYRSNTDSIGLSLACMAGATPGKHGRYPMTETQFLAMAKKAAELCKQYNIQVGPKTVLWHAEVSKNLGIAQRGKWDATELSFEPNVKGAAACGEYLRRAVRLQMSPPVKPVTAAPSKPVQAFRTSPLPVTAPPAKRGFWARLFGWFKGA